MCSVRNEGKRGKGKEGKRGKGKMTKREKGKKGKRGNGKKGGRVRGKKEKGNSQLLNLFLNFVLNAHPLRSSACFRVRRWDETRSVLRLE